MADTPLPTLGRPGFVHRDAVLATRDQLFRVFQLPDPEMRQALFAALLVENSITLLSGTYGTGKTQFARLVRRALFSDGKGGYLFDYETCHQDLTAFDALYHLDLAELQRGREVVHPKAMVTARMKFFNEIQRAGTTFFNALLPFFSEHRVVYRDFEFDVPDFVCLMDRNPQDAGSSEIPEAFMDRIDFSFDIPAIHLQETLALQAIRRTPEGYHWGDLEEMIQPQVIFDDLARVWVDVKRVEIPPRALMLAGMLTDALRLCIVTERSTARADFDLECDACEFHGEICSHLLKVPGQRVTNSTLRLAQALAWLDAVPRLEEGHIRAAFPWSLAHRLKLRPEELRTKPNPLAWVRETAMAEILLPKADHWRRALDAFEALEGGIGGGRAADNTATRRHRDELVRMGESDLVIRSLGLIVG